jgi:exoribonuclease R
MIDGHITVDNCAEAFALRPVHQQPCAPHMPETLVRNSLLFHRIAAARRRRRFAAGSLSLQRAKLSFVLDEAGLPMHHFVYETKAANHMVEEFMLLANELVARQLVMHLGPAALLRRHPQPVAHRLEESAANVRHMLGDPFQVDSSEALFASLKRIHARGDATLAQAVEMLMTHAMQPAEYFAVGDYPKPLWRHYALAFEAYTHFTSPIRRYADVMVHRLLTASLSATPLPSSRPDPAAVAAVANRCNAQKALARKAQEASGRLYLGLLLQGRPIVVQAVVVSFGTASCTLGLLQFGHESRVNFGDCKGVRRYTLLHDGVPKPRSRSDVKDAAVDADEVIMARQSMLLSWKDGADQTFTLLTPVWVRVGAKSEDGPMELTIELLSPRDPDVIKAHAAASEQSSSATAAAVASVTGSQP